MGVAIAFIVGFLIGGWLAMETGRGIYNRKMETIQGSIRDLEGKLPHTLTMRSTLDEIRAREELEKTHRFESHWELMGQKIDKPTPEQMSDPKLIRVERWVKK